MCEHDKRKYEISTYIENSVHINMNMWMYGVNLKAC